MNKTCLSPPEFFPSTTTPELPSLPSLSRGTSPKALVEPVEQEQKSSWVKCKIWNLMFVWNQTSMNCDLKIGVQSKFVLKLIFFFYELLMLHSCTDNVLAQSNSDRSPQCVQHISEPHRPDAVWMLSCIIAAITSSEFTLSAVSHVWTNTKSTGRLLCAYAPFGLCVIYHGADRGSGRGRETLLWWEKRRQNNFHKAPGLFQKPVPEMHSVFCQAVSGQGEWEEGDIVLCLLFPHYADVMHLKLNVALKERAEQAGCVQEINWAHVDSLSWLKERAGAGIFVWLVCEAFSWAQSVRERRSQDEAGSLQSCGNNMQEKELESSTLMNKNITQTSCCAAVELRW